MNSLPRSVQRDLHTDGPIVFEHDAVDETTRPDDEVRPLTRGKQVRDRGREPQTVAPVLREHADTGGLGMVVVGHVRKPEPATDVEERSLGRDQLIGTPAADRDRAAAAVHRIVPVRIVLQAPEVR